MDPVPYPAPQIAGINLDNYVPTKWCYNSVLYIHKKFLPQNKEKPQKNHEVPRVKRTWDKCQQFDSGNLITDAYKVRETNKNNEVRDPVLEQTIRFAKNIIPLTIPPSTDVSPHPEYTIKSIKKSKKKTHYVGNIRSDSGKDATYERERSKSIFEHYRRDKLKRNRDSASARETISSSQNNTLDDINENRTLSCTLSEISEEKQQKEDRHCKRNKRNEMQKVAVSESFEAVATEFMTSGDTKIKIHLMNERDKNLFCENIQTPVIESVKECIMELKNENLKALQCMQSSIENQTKIMEMMLDKLTSLEEKFNLYTTDSTTNMTKTTKPSKLEELSADILHVKGVTSSDEEELGDIDLMSKKAKIKSMEDIKGENFLNRKKNIDTLGCGEKVPMQVTSHLDVKTDRANKGPARFCWTDTERNK